ncbi:zinc ribbon domain-containing protein [Enemella dayhoffiae]|uniref:hypothetical protein n=1 Tax=Enemella dayhoffiae TaxID=2016507 RepID=UPI001594F0E5|nr:hypothetical protein [Enemella dayhoffiae]
MSNNQWSGPGPGGGYGPGPGGPGPQWGGQGGPADPWGGPPGMGGPGGPGPGPGPGGPGPGPGGHGSGGPAFPAYAPQDPKPKKKATPIVIGAIVAVGAVLGAIVGFGVWAGRDTPQKGVDRYFEALNNPYTSNLADQVVNVPSAEQLNDAKTLSASRRSKYEVSNVSLSGTRAKVDYTVDGRAEQTDLELREVNGKYKVVDGFSQLSLKAPAGLELSLGYGNNNLVGKTVPLYPGTYELRGNSGGVLSSYYEIKGGKTITLKPGEKRDHDVQVQLTKNGVDAAKRAVGSAFSKCTLSNDPAPQGCPFSVPAPADKGRSSANWEVSGGARRAYDVADNASVDANQPLNAVCMTFDATLTYEYYTANYDKRTAVAPQNRFTACADMTSRATSGVPPVTWK